MAIVEGLLVNGPVEWYDNLEKQFSVYNGTWIAQNKVLKPEYQQVFSLFNYGKGVLHGLGPRSKSGQEGGVQVRD